MINKTVVFEQIIEECIEHKQYLGLGNPYSNILILGKEAGFEPNDETESKQFESNASIWKDDKKTFSKGFLPTDLRLRNGNHTWQKYQKLYNFY